MSSNEMLTQEWTKILASIPGRKTIVSSTNLLAPLNLILPFNSLNDLGVLNVFPLDKTPQNDQNLIYVLTHNLTDLSFLIQHLKSSFNPRTIYTVVFCPCKSIAGEKILNDSGYFSKISVHFLSLDLLCIESDLYSLEIPNTFHQINLHNNLSPLYQLSKSILKFQVIHGIIPNVFAKGKHAKTLAQLVTKMKSDIPEPSKLFPSTCSFSKMIIIDRNVDLLTPLCIPLTFQGLIDHTLDTPVLKSASIPHSITQHPFESSIKLDSSDLLYAKTMDSNFSTVAYTLNQIAKRLFEDYNQRHQAKTISQIKDFVGKLGSLQSEHKSLGFLVNMTEHLSSFTNSYDFNKCLEIQQLQVSGQSFTTHLDYLDEMIGKEMDSSRVLLLLCLYSVCNGGFKQKQFDRYKSEIVYAYGIHLLFVLDNLTKLELFQTTNNVTPNSFSKVFSNLNKTMNLIVQDVNEFEPQDVSYVYSGYAPLTIRILENLQSQPLDNPIIKSIPGESCHFIQETKTIHKSQIGIREKFLVVYVGGITYGELAAIRFLNKNSQDYEYTILTSDIINSYSFVNPN